MDRESDLEWLLTAFRLQAGGCRLFGSPLYGDLMDAALDDVRSGGPVADLVEGWQGDPVRGFLPLRIFGAVHELVLAGEAPELARYYPTADGTADSAAAWPVFRALVASEADRLRPRLESFPQTNEVRRCAGLLGGFLQAAAETGLPLRIREIGCSAGLNLHWDRFRYELGEHRWGDPSSPVLIATEWRGPPAAFDTKALVESRAACDLSPRDVTSDAALRMLESYIWPDQPERLEQLRAAASVALAEPPRIERAAAGDWLPGELSEPAEGVCTVVYHSSMWMYVPPEEQERIRGILAERGARAGPRDPLAWLRHEDGEVPATVDVRLTLWPAGKERLLGHGHPHGRYVEWL